MQLGVIAIADAAVAGLTNLTPPETAALPSVIAADASLGSPVAYWSPSVLEAAVELGMPTAVTVAALAGLAATAAFGNVTYGLAVNPAVLVANAVISPPEAAILVFPSGLASVAALGEPTWAAVADTYPILAWARLDPILALGYAAAVDATVIIFNTNTLAATEYNIYALDAIDYNGELYFVTTDKLIKLSEDGLENINSYIQTGQLNFGASNIKYVQNMSVDTPPDASLMITGFIEQPNGDIYMFPTKDAYRDSLNQQIRIFKLPKGIRSTYWGFKFENDGTNTFELDDITLDILDTVLKR